MPTLDFVRYAIVVATVFCVVCYALYELRKFVRTCRELSALNDDTRQMHREWLALRAEREFNHRLNRQLHIATRKDRS